MNRRLVIFLIVFFAACGAGLAYTYSLVPVYVASARLQVEPGTHPDEARDPAAFVANETQFLTSNEMLERVLGAIRTRSPDASPGASLLRLRELLTASAAPGSNTIDLHAQGSQREELALVLDIWASAYLESRSVRRTSDRVSDIDEARASVAAAESRVAQKRRELDDFRRRHTIVSPEREENQVAAQLRSLNAALNDARGKAVDAESRLAALKAGIKAGQAVYRPQDKALVAQLEHRALDLRQKLTELERDYTPQYLALEPRARALRANLEQLEQKIESAKRGSQQEMVNEAAQELAGLQRNVARLEEQMGVRRQDALSFTSRFGEHQAKATELTRLEGDLGQAKQRLAVLERKERAREPRYQLLGRPVVPEKPAFPDYTLYAAYSAGAGLVAGLLVVLLVEFLQPRPNLQAPAYPQPIIQIAYPGLAGPMRMETLRLEEGSGNGMLQALPRASAAITTAEAPTPPRELSVNEVRALWEAASPDGRLVIAALFSGLTLEELAALHWHDVKREGGRLDLKAPASRSQPLLEPLLHELEARSGNGTPEGPVAVGRTGALLSARDLEGLLAAAVHDSGLENAAHIDAGMLRHTYVSYLVRMGAKLSELERFVGFVPPAAFLYYRTLSPQPPSASGDRINAVFPAFQSA